MKEIKAYVREQTAARAIEALVQAGYRDLSVLEVRGIARDLPPGANPSSMLLGDTYERVLKIELICRDEHADAAAAMIQRAVTTGRPGDGMVFIAPVLEAISIRDGRRGEQTLEK